MVELQLSNCKSTYRALSILVKVCSACSKKLKTMDRLNACPSSSSSISKICSNVVTSMLSPRSGRPMEPSSLCCYAHQLRQYKYVLIFFWACQQQKATCSAPGKGIDGRVRLTLSSASCRVGSGMVDRSHSGIRGRGEAQERGQRVMMAGGRLRRRLQIWVVADCRWGKFTGASYFDEPKKRGRARGE